MKIREGIEIDDERLADMCRRHHVTELLVFGSALRDDFGPDSDIDVLVTFADGVHVPWGGVAFMQELEVALGRKVDMVHKAGLHWYIRDRVLAEARPMPVTATNHGDTRVNSPTSELSDFFADDEQHPDGSLYPRDPTRSGSTDDVACWLVDTTYNGESFFVRHASFTGGNDPSAQLRRALRADIDESAPSTLYATTSRPFATPATGKVINRYGDEVMQVYEVP